MTSKLTKRHSKPHGHIDECTDSDVLVGWNLDDDVVRRVEVLLRLRIECLHRALATINGDAPAQEYEGFCWAANLPGESPISKTS